MINLRLLTKGDLPFLLEIRNHYSTRINLENDSVFTLEQCELWFETLNSPWYIILKEKTPVGYIRTNGDEIGCDIHPRYRRNGYARSAYMKYLENKNYATLWVFEDNFAKILYEDLGFKITGDSKIVRDRKYLKMIYEK
jgi:RimJ/RimL family protein N-acetyltransferase